MRRFLVSCLASVVLMGFVTPQLATARAEAAAPANDNFAKATQLRGSGNAVSIDPAGATIQPGEPPVAPDVVGTVWYKWRSPSVHTMFAVLLDSWWYPLSVDIYTGTGLSSLKSVVLDAEWTTRDGFEAEGLYAKPATTYYVRIGWYEDEWLSPPYWFEWTASSVANANPDAAWNGTTALIVRDDQDRAFSCIRASRLKGTTVQDGWINVACEYQRADEREMILSKPAVAWNGSNYLVVWREFLVDDWFESYTNIEGALLDANGDLIRYVVVAESDCWYPESACTNVDEPAVAALGSQFLVAWTGVPTDGWEEPTDETRHVRAARVAGDGTVLDASPLVITNATDAREPSLAGGQNDWFVTWHDGRTSGSTGYDVYATRVTAAGAITDPNGVAISNGSQDQWGPAVAWNGSQFYTAWSDDRAVGATVHDVYGTRVSGGGVVLDPEGTQVTGAADEQNGVTVAPSGTNFVVAWQDARSDPDFDIYFNRIGPSGGVLNGGGAKVSGTPARQANPAAVALAPGSVLVVWEDESNGDPDIYAARVTTAGAVQDKAGIRLTK